MKELSRSILYLFGPFGWKTLAVLLAWLIALLGGIPPAWAQERPVQLDLAAGVHTYHLPGLGAAWQPSGYSLFAGAHQPLNRRQSLGLTLRLGYARDKRQGDALQAQLLFNFTPLIARHFEAGLALGGGYQWSFYPSRPLHWDGSEWTAGKRVKGVFQAPLQLSLGYRSIEAGRYRYTPYLAYQVQVLFGYSPDLSPLPVSHALLGVRIAGRSKEGE